MPQPGGIPMEPSPTILEPIGPPPAARRPSRPGGGYGLRHMMYFIVWIALLLAAVVHFGMALLVFVLTFSPLALIVGVIAILVRRRTTQQEALLRVMAIAAERRMPLSPGIEACAELCGGSYRRKAMGLAYLLEAGVPLPQALASIPGLLPRASVVLACVGWNDGALGIALRGAVDAEAARRSYRYAFIPKFGYLAAVLFFLQAILAFILYFITPKFEAIFADFGVDLPPLTVFTIKAGHVIGRSGIVVFVALMELLVLAYVPFSYFGWVQWDLPGLGWLLRRRDSAAILRSLAIGVEAGRPMPAEIALLAGFYPRERIRRRLENAHRLIEAGEPWLAALSNHGLVSRSDAAVLDAAARAGNLPWALRAMADGNDRRLGFKLAALAQTLFPVIVIALGIVVGTIAISYFLPLIILIERLAG